MLRFLMQRLLALIPVLFIVAVVVFLILRLTPGDPAAVIAGNNATNEDIDRIREQLGLNRPLITQFMIWLGNVLQGDLGYSFYLNKPVTELIAQRIEPTLSLAAGTMVLAVLVVPTAFAANVAFPSAPMSQYTATDLRPKATGGAANVGVVIPNVNDGYSGTAPDAGAYEAGAALPVYGPR